MVMIPTLPSKWVAYVLGAVLLSGALYTYGYYKGYQSQAERTERALRELLLKEQELAKVASEQATRDTQRLVESRIEASNLRRAYEEAKPSDLDPVACVSDDQRRVLQEIARSTE